MTTPRSEVKAALDRLNGFMSQADPAIIAQFDPDADVLLAGSEIGEVVRGHTDIGAFFRAIFALPLRIGWHWDTIDAAAEGDVIWFFAEGQAVVTRDGVTDARPYRLSGVLVRRGITVIWRQFHGSEPRP
jgi:hypothetical protein